MDRILFGTCSWNYDSWVGLVYSERRRSAAEYLAEYGRAFDTAEIDSWFYKLPAREEVEAYLAAAPSSLRFTCKVTEDICLSHKRNLAHPEQRLPNRSFLSVELFNRYLDAIGPMLPRIDAVMLEFEYLSHERMDSLDSFLGKLDAFVQAVGGGIPIAVEVRNRNYLVEEYFRFLKDRRIVPVLSEKQHLPHAYELSERHAELIEGDVVLRLLGGDRKAMESRTGQRWDRIVEPKPDKDRIARAALEIAHRGGRIVINVNNHYEGSAPLTARELRALVEAGEAGPRS